VNREHGDMRTAILSMHEEFEQMEIAEMSRVSGISGGAMVDNTLQVRRERQGLIIMLKAPMQELIGIPQVMEQASNETAIKAVSKVANQIIHAVKGGGG
jgi:hypothetical protein